MGNNHMKTIQIAIGVVMVALLCVPASAQSPAPASDAAASPRAEGKPWNRGTTLAVREAANTLFLEGNRLFRNAIFSRAAAQYTAALAQWQHPAFNFNLALAQMNLGQEVDARENLERAIRYGADPLGADKFEEAQKQLHYLESKLGRIRIRCQTQGAVVSLDGVKLFVGPGNYAGWAKAKPHELTVRAPEYLSESRQIAIRAGVVEQLDLKLITLDEAADRNRRWAVWKPWVVVGAGAAIAAGGGVFHLLSARNVDSYDAEALRLGCANDVAMPGCRDGQLPKELHDQLGRARRQHTVAVTGYITGGAVAAVGIVMWWLNRPRLDEDARSSRGQRVAVVPALSADMVGLFVRIEP